MKYPLIVMCIFSFLTAEADSPFDHSDPNYMSTVVSDSKNLIFMIDKLKSTQFKNCTTGIRTDLSKTSDFFSVDYISLTDDKHAEEYGINIKYFGSAPMVDQLSPNAKFEKRDDKTVYIRHNKDSENTTMDYFAFYMNKDLSIKKVNIVSCEKISFFKSKCRAVASCIAK